MAIPQNFFSLKVHQSRDASVTVLAVFTSSLLKFCISSIAIKQLPGIEKRYASIRRRHGPTAQSQGHRQARQHSKTVKETFKTEKWFKRAKTSPHLLEVIEENQHKKEIPRNSTFSVHEVIDVSHIDVDSRDNIQFEKMRCNYFCFYNEIWGLTTGVVFQDIPFLIVRIFVISRFRVLQHSMIFFACKNIITIILMTHRIVAIAKQEHKPWQEQMKEMKKYYYSEKPQTYYRNLSNFYDDSWSENGQICGLRRWGSVEYDDTVFER